MRHFANTLPDTLKAKQEILADREPMRQGNVRSKMMEIQTALRKFRLEFDSLSALEQQQAWEATVAAQTRNPAFGQAKLPGICLA